jgi:glucan 1,3-beta-glucosidase
MFASKSTERDPPVFDSGTYLVSKTIFIPVGTQIVGDMFSTILGNGVAFTNQANPTPVIKVFCPGFSASSAIR